MPLGVEKKVLIKKVVEKKSRTKVNADWRGKYLSSWRRAPGAAQDWLGAGLGLVQNWPQMSSIKRWPDLLKLAR